MKIFVVGLILSFVSTGSFCQQRAPDQIYTYQDYMKKSKNSKAVGLIFLGIGVIVLPTAGRASSLDEVESLAIGSLALILTSIPLFIDSAHNKKKAMEHPSYIEKQGSHIPVQSNLMYQYSPIFSLNIGF